MKKNNERYLVKIIKEICLQNNIKLKSLSFDWILVLNKNGVQKFVYGYNFDSNSAASQMIANDKTALSDVLNLSNIQNIEHKLFINPKLSNYIGIDGNWSNILSYFNNNDEDIICKPISGTGGNDVFHIKTINQLEEKVHYLFSKYRSIALSPFINIKEEYRTIVVNNKIELIYQKNIPHIIGDGKSSIIDLLKSKYDDQSLLAEMIIGVNENNLDYNLSSILESGFIFKLGWQNNLGKGSIPELLDSNSPKAKKIIRLAIEAAKSIDIRFASIDIVEDNNSKFFVLEVNSGVMTENFIELLPEYYNQIKTIYEKAVINMFG